MLDSRRAPLLAAIGVGVIGLLVVLFLVLPKLGQVSEAETALSQEEATEQTLLSEKQALEGARDRESQNRQIIKEVDRRIPPVADLPGLILLLENAAVQSGIDVLSLSPSTPTEGTGGFSVIAVSISAEGTYFDVTEFLYKIETLPRASKALSVSLSPGESVGGIPTLSASVSIELYTSDISAGPGSQPGATAPSNEADATASPSPEPEQP